MLAAPVALWTGKLTRRPGAMGVSSKLSRSKAIMMLSFRCTVVCSEYRRSVLRLSRFAVHFCAMNRKYELKERARRQSQTRQRIVEAAVDLHTSVGPARTTISGIAERAGVERHTVYAHFPDDLTLFRACSEHWEARHPPPDLGDAGRDRRPGAPPSPCSRRAVRVVRLGRGRSGAVRSRRLRRPANAEITDRDDVRSSRRWPTPSHTAGHAARASERRSGTRSSSRRGARSSAGRASRGRRRSTR